MSPKGRGAAQVSQSAPQAWWTPVQAYATPAANADDQAGEDYSFQHFVGLKGDGRFSRVDLPKLGTDFAMPLFLVRGAHDRLTTRDVTERDVESIAAPRKVLVVLPRTGHDSNPEMIDARFRVLEERILPLATP